MTHDNVTNRQTRFSLTSTQGPPPTTTVGSSGAFHELPPAAPPLRSPPYIFSTKDLFHFFFYLKIYFSFSSDHFDGTMFIWVVTSHLKYEMKNLSDREKVETKMEVRRKLRCHTFLMLAFTTGQHISYMIIPRLITRNDSQSNYFKNTLHCTVNACLNGMWQQALED